MSCDPDSPRAESKTDLLYKTGGAHCEGQTLAAKSAIVALMADEEAIPRKHDLLATAMHYYFWLTGAEVIVRWKEAMPGLLPSVLRELAGRL
jgi:hypothetical protein